MKGTVLFAIAIIDRMNRRLSETVRWLVVVIPVIIVGHALVRKLTDWGRNGMTEAQWFLFGQVPSTDAQIIYDGVAASAPTKALP